MKPESELDKLRVFVRSTDFPSMSRELFATPNSVIQVNGNGNCIYTWSVKSNVKEQQEYDEYLYAAKDLWDKVQQIQAEVSGLWGIIDSSQIIAWCPLSEIEPYKE